MTDDTEREALGILIRDIYREHGYYAADQVVADAILAAGYRRLEPAGEPSDAQVKAALDSWVDADFHAKHPKSVAYWEPRMRAALRAAFAVGEGEVR